jgi:iron(III) transport system substrate-binding protein
MRNLTKFLTALLVSVLAAALLVGCGDDGDDSATPDATPSDTTPGDTTPGDTVPGEELEGSLTVYVGRSEDLIQPLIDQFIDETGVSVDVRYGDSTDMALLIQTEGDRSPADVYISQSPGAVALLANEGLLAAVDDDVLDLVQPAYRANDGTWVGLSGRQRVVVFNQDTVTPADLPDSIEDLVDERYRGMVGVAPTNASFQDFVTAMRAEIGDEATLEWLQGLADNDPQIYEKNGAIVEAVGRGEVAMGLVNHYYNEAALAEDPDLPSRNHFLSTDDIGSLVLVASGSVLASSDNTELGNRFLAFMLTEESQRYFTTETFESALIDGVEPPGDLPPLTGLSVQAIDYDVLGDELERTIELIDESGLAS